MGVRYETHRKMQELLGRTKIVQGNLMQTPGEKIVMTDD